MRLGSWSLSCEKQRASNIDSAGIGFVHGKGPLARLLGERAPHQRLPHALAAVSFAVCKGTRTRGASFTEAAAQGPSLAALELEEQFQGPAAAWAHPPPGL